MDQSFRYFNAPDVIEQFYVPASMVEIYEQCDQKIRDYVVDPKSKHFRSKNGVLYTLDDEKSKSRIVGYPAKDTLIIPKEVKEINYVCLYIMDYKEILVEEGNTVFSKENGLLLKYNKWIFTDANVDKVVIPDGVSFIGDNESMKNNICGKSSKLNTIVIPRSDIRITYDCIPFNASVNIDFTCDDYDFRTNWYFGLFICSVKLPKHLTNISNFESTKNLTDIVIPGTVVQISRKAFKNCIDLKRVVISEGVKEIGTEAFSCCDSLEEVVLPKSLERIMSDAFKGCPNLKGMRRKAERIPGLVIAKSSFDD